MVDTDVWSGVVAGWLVFVFTVLFFFSLLTYIRLKTDENSSYFASKKCFHETVMAMCVTRIFQFLLLVFKKFGVVPFTPFMELLLFLSADVAAFLFLVVYVCVTISWYLFIEAIQYRDPFSDIREVSKRSFRILQSVAAGLVIFDTTLNLTLFFCRKFFWLVFIHVYFTVLYCCCLVLESLAAIVIAVMVVQTLLRISNYNLASNDFLTSQVAQVVATALLITVIFFFCVFIVFSAITGKNVESVKSSEKGIIVAWDENVIIYFLFYTFGQFVPVSIMVSLQSKLPQISVTKDGDMGDPSSSFVDSTHPPTFSPSSSSYDDAVSEPLIYSRREAVIWKDQEDRERERREKFPL